MTRTWFHTGAWIEGNRLEAFFNDPANREYFAGDHAAASLGDTQFPASLTPFEERESCRALRGSVLREEVYAEDGSPKAAVPYTVSERRYRVQRLQGQGPNRHAVFLSHSSQALNYQYERDVSAPRIGHEVTLAVDVFGNVTSAVSIGYASRTPKDIEQTRALATFTENEYTNEVDTADAYRTPLPARSTTYELTAPALAGATPLTLDAIEALTKAAQRRLIGHVVTLYRSDDLTRLLPVRHLESMALAGESYRQASTPKLRDDVFARLFKKPGPWAQECLEVRL